MIAEHAGAARQLVTHVDVVQNGGRWWATLAADGPDEDVDEAIRFVHNVALDGLERHRAEAHRADPCVEAPVAVAQRPGLLTRLRRRRGERAA